MLVKAMPIAIPRSGFEKVVSVFMNVSLERRSYTALLIAFMPYIRTAKPSMISPTCFFSGAAQNMRMAMPATAIIAVSVSVDRSSSQPEEPPPMSDRQIIQPVTLVPIIAPMTTPMA